MDSNNWKNLTVMRDSLTDDKLFAQYYFCTPLELLNSQPKDRPIIYIKVGYYKNNVTNYSESGKIYQSCPNPDPTLPSGVVGQGVIPGKHFMTECAEVTPVSNNGVLSGWKLHGHIQVKNESPGILKTINLIYRTNTMDWVRGAQERTYPILYATRTTNLFYGNGYKGGVENWEFTTIFPPSVFSIQFIGWDKVVTNYAAWADRNRCRKYHVNPFPGVVLTYQTND
jgi:hypothetical protein